ncbi:anti-sigma factor family protein [Kangiella sediminilitoris]|uniref:Putative transmembrane anti-sigma factor n=1 Tax=Kangiella sediminilitoris TaxID=1144748 RepID=A0A1B3BD88_9GAMM|nr:zf-HC2 domain-containing protein [Kangiella sediminilitoris]AOE50728.1 Putative transmembrane anti-sigma factor [Kangiella sediminilitoris]
MNQCEHIQELVSGYIDNELTQQKSQKVRLHLKECDSCRKIYDDLIAIRQEMGQLSYPECEESKIEALMNEPTSKLFGVIGWLCLTIGLLGFMIWQLFVFYTEPGIVTWVKIGVLLIEVGVLSLFISVLRQRLIARKTDKYRNVKL